MAAPHKKLAASLAELEKLQHDGRRVFRSSEFTRVHRERLRKNGYLRDVMKGWLISWSPGADVQDTTPWYASLWEFYARYCQERFGDDWHLSPEQSLLLHAENTVVPRQLLIYTPKGTNNTIELLFGTSLYDLKEKESPPKADLTAREGLRLFTPEAALIKVPEAFFAQNPVEAQVALISIRDASDVLRRLLAGGHSTIAGRLAGAFRRIGRGGIADEILSTMRAADYKVSESDPFEPAHVFGVVDRHKAPIVSRIEAIWESARGQILEIFPPAPGLPQDTEGYMAFVDEIYANDAYHSLSIEGYRVTPDLIARVRAGNWDPDHHDADRDSRDALAARGYWQAFQHVRESVSRIIAGEPVGPLTEEAHKVWYRELFQPCVTAGLIRAGALAGYRNYAVYLCGSRHVPPRWETVRDAMPALFDMLEREPEPAVRAVLGHWFFGYIHPYPDGNGRIARFLMNTMLASGGYPWTVIRVDDRDAYLKALERASVGQEITPFATFIAERVRWSLDKAT